MSENQDKMLKIGIPKGSLQDATVDLFGRAGYSVRVPSRSYIPVIDDDQMSGVLFRAQEMSRYVEDGVVDMGITGHDWVVENDSDVVEVCELKYSKATSNPARWVLAVAEESGMDKIEDLEGKIIATELPETTKRFFKEKGVNAKVEFSWGATEVKARLVDGIVDVTETGSSLRANKLKVLAELLSSTTRLIANKDAWNDPWKRQKIEDLALLLQGAIAAKSKVGLKMNVEKSKLDEVLKLLPSEQSPTVNQLADDAWVAIEVIVESKIEREIVPQLTRAGAKAIFSYPLNKVIS
ncbi:ATP phosphoribosyltransferase [Planctomycetota bacterium]|nr:ATP phosphoribosyltransferase [Planctomycetota bacterium]